MKKKSLIFSRCVLYALLLSFSLQAQVIVNLQQAPPNQWHVEDMWQLNLTNQANEDLEVYLYATIEEEDAGIIFEATSASFTMEANYSGPVNRGDLEPVDVEYHDGDYEDIFQRTGTLPAGNYTICVYVKSVDGENMGNDCIMQIIAHPSPPELINPVDEANITEELPVFLWLPPMPMGEFVTYSIKLVELLDGQTPIEAMEANPAFYIEEDIPASSFQYPIFAREFEQGITYAWKVTAISGDGFVIGDSPVWSFNYEVAGVVIDEEPGSIELISPVNGEEIIDPELLFEWMPINTALVTLAVTPEASYNLTIWSLSEDLIKKIAEGYMLTKEDLSELEPYFVKTGIEWTSFVYMDTTDYPLVPGFTYVWQVTGWLGDWKIGFSEGWIFQVGTDTVATLTTFTLWGHVEGPKDNENKVPIIPYNSEGEKSKEKKIKIPPTFTTTLKECMWVNITGVITGKGKDVEYAAIVVEVIIEEKLKENIEKRIGELIKDKSIVNLKSKINISLGSIENAEKLEGWAINGHVEDNNRIYDKLVDIENRIRKKGIFITANQISTARKKIDSALNEEKNAKAKVINARNSIKAALNKKELKKLKNKVKKIQENEKKNTVAGKMAAIEGKKEAIKKLEGVIEKLKEAKSNIERAKTHIVLALTAKTNAQTLLGKAVNNLPQNDPDKKNLKKNIIPIEYSIKGLGKSQRNMDSAIKELNGVISKLEKMLEDLRKCLVIERASK